MTTSPFTYNDRNVYILGAGFSADAGHPIISEFLNAMRDSVEWLRDQGWDAEVESIRKVMEFRRRAAAATHRVEVDLENVEDLFSLASASDAESFENDVRRAIAGTLAYSKATLGRNNFATVLYEEAPSTLPKNWEPQSSGSNLWHHVPPYESYLGLMSGYFADKPAHGDESWNTFITFNYDLNIEAALTGLAIPFSYGFPRQSTRKHRSAHTLSYSISKNSIPVLKLHGSLNWAIPAASQQRLTVYGDYSDVRQKDLVPLLVPPTWRKDLSGQLVHVWDAAVKALSTATRIVILGFSARESDAYFKYLLAAGLRDNISLRRIDFVNPWRRHEDLEDRLGRVLRISAVGEVNFYALRTDEYMQRIGRDEGMGRKFISPFQQVNTE